MGNGIAATGNGIAATGKSVVAADAGALAALVERVCVLEDELDDLRRELALVRALAAKPAIVNNTYNTSSNGPGATVFAGEARVADVSCDKRQDLKGGLREAATRGGGAAVAGLNEDVVTA